MHFGELYSVEQLQPLQRDLLLLLLLLRAVLHHLHVWVSVMAELLVERLKINGLHLVASSQVCQLVHMEVDVPSNGHVWGDLVQIRQDLEVLLRLLVQLLAVLCHVEQERSKQVLKHFQYFFDPPVDEYCANEGLKDVAHDLAGLENLDLPVVHLEVLFEGVADVAVQVVLLAHLLLLFLRFPLRHHTPAPITTQVIRIGVRSGVRRGLLLLVEDELLDAEQSDQLRQEVVLCQQRLCLVSVKRLEVFLRDVSLVEALLDVIFLKHCVLDEIRIRNVIEDSVAQHFHLLIAGSQTVSLFETPMGQGLKQQIFVCKFEVKDLFHWSTDKFFQLLYQADRVIVL